MRTDKPKVFMFVNYTPDDKSLGITKKIGAEIEAFRRLGYEVVYTAYTQDGIGIFNNNGEKVYSIRYVINNRKIQGVIRYFLLVEAALRYARKSNSFDVFYGRLLAPNMRYLNLLRLFHQNGSEVILEAHAYFPGIKFKSIKGRYVSFMLRKNGPKLARYVDRILTEGYIEDFYGIRDVRETRIGVETNKFSPHKYTGRKDQLNLVSVANEIAYHGYDRIIKSLGAYYSNCENPKDVRIHFVGTISDATKELISSLGLQERVLLYGKQYGEKLDQIYSACNIGLGPFGQHRIGGKKDTGLKTKEYFAKGLPYVFSGEEPTVPKDYPYIHCFPSDESLIDFDEVWDFYQTFADDDQVVEKMRSFSINNYSWDRILEEALAEK